MDDRELLVAFCSWVAQEAGMSLTDVAPERIDAFLASRQSPGDPCDVSPPTRDYLDNPTDCSCPVAAPSAPCPECRDRPGHIATTGQETACGTCGRTYAPGEPQTMIAGDVVGYVARIRTPAPQRKP